jgi:hypothetical protein
MGRAARSTLGALILTGLGPSPEELQSAAPAIVQIGTSITVRRRGVILLSGKCRAAFIDRRLHANMSAGSSQNVHAKVPFYRSSDPRMFGHNVQVDELGWPVEYLRHQLADGLKSRLTAWILLACASLLLAFERHDHVQRVGILLVTGRRRPNKSRTRLFEGLELISKRRKLGVLAWPKSRLDDLDPHWRAPSSRTTDRRLKRTTRRLAAQTSDAGVAGEVAAATRCA